MKAMVLAAGRGERLRPLTDTLPKPLIPVAGRPLIHHTLRYLRAAGVEEAVINLHHLGDQIQAFVGDGRSWGLRVRYSRERLLLGTGGGIQQVASQLCDGTFAVMNADVVVDLALADVVRFHRRNGAVATLVLRRDPEVERYGAIEVDGYGRVRQIVGRLPVPRGPWTKLMFTGIHILEPSVFDHMPTNKTVFSIIDVYLEMVRSGERVLGYEMTGFWTDLGTPERYEAFRRGLEEGRNPAPGFLAED